MNNRKQKKIWYLIFFLILLFLDQWTKYVAVMRLKSQPSFSLIPGIFEIVYVENTGSAWGMLSGMRFFLIVITAVLMFVIIHYYRTLPSDARYNAARYLTVSLLAGALGNMIDRIRLGYVIDFLYFELIDFPVFNVADAYITVSIALLLIVYWKEILVWMKNG